MFKKWLLVVAALSAFATADYEYAGINLSLAKAVAQEGNILILLNLTKSYRDGLNIEATVIILGLLLVLLKSLGMTHMKILYFSSKN